MNAPTALPNDENTREWNQRASRVRELAIGTSVPISELTVDRLASALRAASEPGVAERAKAFASEIATDGAVVDARRLTGHVS